ncbi:VWA domain-containing protein [uncultured Massilia sp.]|uniref:VWA domain-containing protein n=1 Tax=uncultured Massilia sp. TaxID=169973 RepID=UPI0025E192B6|nr:VWA domain-containing protein [uncultured Massilia sp.]
MLSPFDAIRAAWNPMGLATNVLASIGIKPFRYFIDSVLRDKATPVPGSVLYCDLWMAVEHSGIYVGDGAIVNIVVDGVAESTVERSGPASFTSKSLVGRKIYVSCDAHGAVGHRDVADGAATHVGERAFYGLVFKNCHQFSTKCVHYVARAGEPALADLLPAGVPDTWEPTLGMLKTAARRRLGATKWRLWDWEAGAGDEAPPPAPDWQAHRDALCRQPLDAGSAAQLRDQLAETLAYEAEIADERLPEAIGRELASLRTTLADIVRKYDEVKDFLALFPGARFSYADLRHADDDYAALAHTLQDNTRIRDLVRRLGRDVVDETSRLRTRIPQASRNETYGTHRSGDVMRILPGELLNLKDETLDVLFYARLLENNLLSYALRGREFVDGEMAAASRQRTGPVVACLDTSASMQGEPLRKARALLLAIAAILDKEGRALHVLLFGAGGELRELSLAGPGEVPALLRFLRGGFGGGTDFETPLRRALDLVAAEETYRKADVLMVSDGDCSLSPAFLDTLCARKRALGCTIHSVLCAGSRVEDAFSDEVLVL